MPRSAFKTHRNAAKPACQYHPIPPKTRDAISHASDWDISESVIGLIRVWEP